MRRKFRLLLAFSLVLGTFFHGLAVAAPKIHTIVFGKWTSVQWIAGTGAEDKALMIKIRALVVDGRVKEYVLGTPHEVTDRLFVARRMFRLNDSLPEDLSPRWQWQRGGWLLVDRITGKIAALNLPDYDAFYSSASWYRDYVAYCGVADDGKKTYAVVAELGRRKPVLKKILSEGLAEDAKPDSACSTPEWQKGPVRVSFDSGSSKQTFAIRGHVVDVLPDAPEDDE
jgi:hypothetical protein